MDEQKKFRFRNAELIELIAEKYNLDPATCILEAAIIPSLDLDSPKQIHLGLAGNLKKGEDGEYLEDPTLFDFKPGKYDRDQDIKADKQLRKNLDEQLQNLRDCPNSNERSLAITKLQEAIMWLGMDLKRLNESNPYPDSYDPSNTKIAPTSDGLKL